MSYIDIISLAQAKNYLRVDVDLTADDDSITVMINSAFKYIEQYTSVIMFERTKTYLLRDLCVRVYDYPIINEVTTDLSHFNKGLYRIYSTKDYNLTEIELTIGFSTPAEVPDDLRLAAFEIIDIYYYGKETGKTMLDLSPLSKAALDQHKRFLM